MQICEIGLQQSDFDPHSCPRCGDKIGYDYGTARCVNEDCDWFAEDGILYELLGYEEEAEGFRCSACGRIFPSDGEQQAPLCNECSSLKTAFELTRDDIRIDQELIVEGHTVNAYIETWFDVKEKFGVQLQGDDEIDFYGDYNGDTGELRLFYIIKRQDVHEKRTYAPIGSEKELILEYMERTCQTVHGCSLRDLIAGSEQ